MLQNCFTRRALKEQFVTQRTLQGHSKGTQRTLGHLDTLVLKAVGQLRACSSLPTLINVFGMSNILDDVESPMYVFSLPN